METPHIPWLPRIPKEPTRPRRHDTSVRQPESLRSIAVQTGTDIPWVATCHPCGWIGPTRATQSLAETDRIRHVADLEVVE